MNQGGSRVGESDTSGNGRSVVPRFFFHVRGSRQGLSRDELGFDLPDVETARLMTISAARDLQGLFSSRGKNPKDYTIEVRNAANELVFELPFTLAFEHQEFRLPQRFLH